jgi:cytochrome P450
MAQKMVQQRRQENTGGENDFLSLLVSLGDKNDRYSASERQIRDEVMTFLLAGHETTAATLIWTWYLLSQHAEVENRLHRELEEVLAGHKPSLLDLPRLVYTKMLVEEVLRLYPPVWMISRKAIKDDQIGGYIIPANSDVLLSIYTLHRHPAFWYSPEEFDPERFTAGRSSQRVPCSYLPFGVGPRSCIGSRFGLMEVILVVTTIAQRYHLELASDHLIEPETLLTLRPRSAVSMRLMKRR